MRSPRLSLISDVIINEYNTFSISCMRALKVLAFQIDLFACQGDDV